MYGWFAEKIVVAVSSFIEGNLNSRLAGAKENEATCRQLSDEELKKAVATALAEAGKARPRGSPLLRLVRAFLPIFDSPDDKTILHAVGVLSEAFRRAPADLLPEPGATEVGLFPQQITAALALLDGCLVQMDTGEGKTYAILPAAACLVARHQRVFVLCANEYLAERDGKRTRSFWEFIGLRVGLFLENSPDEELDCAVVYTTLRTLVVRKMREGTGSHRLARTVGFGAIIVDEADAVLIDEAFTPFVIVAPVKGRAYDWSTATDLAAKLDRDEHVVEDYISMTVVLSVAGEAFLGQEAAARGFSQTEYLSLRHAVELSYVATRMAREEVHYIVSGDTLVTIDSRTGLKAPGVNPGWLVPLKIARGVDASMTIAMDKMWPTNMLIDFDHICGLSGTVREDAAEYLLSYGLPTVVIPPRRERKGDISRDMVFNTKEELRREAHRRIAAAVADGRPVLVGTQSVEDADLQYEMAVSDGSLTADLRLLTAKNDYGAAEIFAEAGRPGRVTIATQFAGRGVDIRLTEEARRAGGLQLLGLGRNRTPRHDRQFLGRAGRQGAPFSAAFLLSLDDDLMKIFGTARMRALLERLGLEEGEAITHTWVDKALRTAQAKVLFADFLRRRHANYIKDVHAEARGRMVSWFNLLKQEPGGTEVVPSGAFLHHAVEHFIAVQCAPLRSQRSISDEIASQTLAVITDLLSLPSVGLSPFDLEGMFGETAVGTIRDALLERLAEKFAQAAALKEELNERVARAAAQAEKARELADLSHESGNPLDARFFDRRATIDLPEQVLRQRFAFKEREPFDIAHLVLETAWMDIIAAADRKAFTASHSRLTSLEYFRLLTDEILELIDRKDDEISTLLLRRLLCADRPEILDDLFRIRDQRTTKHFVATPRRGRLMHDVGGNGDATMPPQPSAGDDDLIRHFLAGPGQELCTTKHDVEALDYMLLNFLTEFPLSQLRSPERVAETVQKWLMAESRRHIDPRKRHWRRKALNRFLQFLEDRGLIPAVPQAIHLAKAFFGRMVSNLKELRAIGPMLGLVTVVVGLAGLSLITVAPPLNELPASWQLIDLLVFGGLLTHSALTAPAIGALVLGPLAVKAVFPGVKLIVHLRGVGGLIGKWLLIPLIAGAIIVLAGGGHLGVGEAIDVAWIAVACVLLFSAASSFMVLVDAEIGVSLYDGWFGFVAALFLHHLLTTLAWQEATIAACAAVAVLSMVRSRIAVFSLPCYSRRTQDSYTMTGEEVPVDLVVRAPRLTEATVYAAIISYTLWEVVDLSHGLAITAGSFVLLAFVTQWILTSRACNAELWRKHMNRNQERFAGPNDRTYESMLRRNKRRFLALDAGFLVLSVGLWLAADRAFALSDTFAGPVPILAVSVIVLFVDTSGNFLSSVWRFILNRGALEAPRFEYTSEKQDESLNVWEKARLVLSKRFVLILTVVIILFRGADAVRAVWQYFTNP